MRLKRSATSTLDIRTFWLRTANATKKLVQAHMLGWFGRIPMRDTNLPSVMFLILLICLIDSCSQSKPDDKQLYQSTASHSAPVRGDDSDKCLEAARTGLGPRGIVLKCGHLTGDTNLEAVVALRVPGLADDRNGIPISRLKVLREDRDQWDTQLNVDREVTNDAGYLGVNFIDDAHPFPYYRVSFTDSGAKWGARTPSQFTLILFSMSRNGTLQPGDLGLGIGWNAVVGRFQEIEPNGDQFAPEVKVPKHLKAR